MRKPIIELEKFRKNEAEIEESSVDEMKTVRRGNFNVNEEIESLQQEVDDANHLIKKLKKERNEYLQKYKQFEGENLHIKETIREQIEVLNEHSQRKLEIREGAYV